MYVEPGWTVANNFDNDEGTILAVYDDDVKVLWTDGSTTYESLDEIGQSWWKI